MLLKITVLSLTADILQKNALKMSLWEFQCYSGVKLNLISLGGMSRLTEVPFWGEHNFNNFQIFALLHYTLKDSKPLKNAKKKKI